MEEELEPLFDYRRAQQPKPPPIPLTFDDDDCCFDVDFIGAKKKKKKKAKCDPQGKEKKGVVVVSLDDDDDDDEKGKKDDWLPSPPPRKKTPQLQVDQTIRELRLKKQELASFAQSVEDILKEVNESAKPETSASGKSPAESKTAKLKPRVERPKVVISIQAKDGNKQFRVNKDDKLDKLFKTYAERAKISFESLAFCFDGDKVMPGATPASLGMEDEDMIEVHIKKSC